MVWLKARVEGSMFQQNHSFFEKVCSKQKHLFGDSSKLLAFIYEPHAYWFSYREDIFLSFGKSLVERFLKTGFEKFEKHCFNVINAMRRLFARLDKDLKHINNLSDKDLADLYLRALKTQDNFAVYTLTCEPAELYLNKILRQRLVRLVGGSEKKVNEYFIVLTTPKQLSFVQKEKNELLDIARKKKQGMDIKDLISKHTKKWWFIRNNYARQMRVHERYFMKRLEILINKKEKKIVVANTKKKQILATLDDKELEKIVGVIEKYIHLRDIRKMELLKWIYYINIIIKEFAKRLRLGFEDACFLTHHEIIDCLLKNKKIDRTVIQARKHAVSVYDEKGAHILIGQQAERWREKIFGKVEKNKGLLKGLAVSSGVVKGRVKVLTSRLQAHKLNKGDVLVTSHTTPDWVVVMEKASAIITEKGGLTSHAAIISRELKIPCVVGVANVTQILKDNDIVQIDGTKGIVKVLGHDPSS